MHVNLRPKPGRLNQNRLVSFVVISFFPLPIQTLLPFLRRYWDDFSLVILEVIRMNRKVIYHYKDLQNDELVLTHSAEFCIREERGNSLLFCF